MSYIIYTILGFFLTFFGIGLFLNWTKKREIFDVPNERSSHTKPTPVGGGLIFVIVILILFLVFFISKNGEIPWAYFGGAVLIAAVSWLDDLYSIPVYIRFLCHSFAALLVIYGLGTDGNIYLPLIGNLQIGQFIYVIWFLWIVWLINAYNFMDGIDGIAGVQAVTAGIGWLIVGYLQGIEEITILGILITASNAAFLKYNWQPAKIFMGDVGSAFLGFTFAVFPLISFHRNQNDSNALFLTAIFFVWFFVFDSVRTFSVRLLKGEKVWQAHRRHLYQKLVIEGFSHRFVTLFYGVLSVSVVSVTILSLYFEVFEALYLYILVAVVSALLTVFTLYYSKNTSEV